MVRSDLSHLLAVGMVLTAGALNASTIPSSISTAENALVLNTNDNNYDTSLTNATKWTPGVTGGTIITPNQLTSPYEASVGASDKIYVTSNKTFRTYKDPQNSPQLSGYTKGRVLRVGGKEWHIGGQFCLAAVFAYQPVSMPPMHVYDKAYMRVNTQIGLTNTEVIVHSSASNPFCMDMSAKDMGINFYETTFRSGEDVGSNAGMRWYSKSVPATHTYYLRDCDFSGFTGTLSLGYPAGTSNVTAVIERGAVNFPGTLVINPKGIFKSRSSSLVAVSNCEASAATLQIGYSGAWQFDTLDISAGMKEFTVQDPTFADDRAACFTVTNRFAMPSGAIPLTFSGVGTTDVFRRLPIFRLTADVRDLSGNPITLSTSQFALNDSSDLQLAVTQDEDGGQTLWAEQWPVVTLVLTDSQSTNASGVTIPLSIMPGGGPRWSDGQDLHDKVIYQVSGGKRIYFNTNNFVFPNSVLKITNSGLLDINDAVTRVLTISNLVLDSNAGFRNFRSGTPPTVLNGQIKVTAPENKPAFFYCYQLNNAEKMGGTRVDAEIVGSGALDLLWRGKDTSYGRLELTGLNTNYTGKIKVACYSYSWSSPQDYTPMSEKFLRVWVHDQRNLGGPLSDATLPRYDALTVRDRQMLWVTNETTHNVVFDEPTRGIYVPWWGRFGADSNMTFTIKQQVTYEGRLQKVGAGTLALGGTARFTKNVLTTPYIGETFLEGTNVLDIAEGSLMPLSTEAFAGVAVVFSNGTSIVIDPAATGDVATYGIKSVAAGSSISIPDGNVNLRFAGERPSGGITCAVATFASEEAANEFMSKLATPRPWRGCKTALSVVERTEQDESKVYVVTASVTRNGMCILIQ